MKKITMYEADDGKVFKTLEEVQDYEGVLAKCQEIFKPLGVRPDSCDYVNGGGYLQHDVNTVAKVKKQFEKLMHETTVPAVYGIDTYGFGRTLSDIDSPAYPFFIRLSCINDSGREYGQPYYAANPHRAEQLLLN